MGPSKWYIPQQKLYEYIKIAWVRDGNPSYQRAKVKQRSAVTDYTYLILVAALN
jgi:hypothetical protein